MEICLLILIYTVSQAGQLHINGQLRTCEVTMMTGLLSGSGHNIKAPSVYVIGGVLSPGSNKEIGILTIDGDLILSSKSVHFVNLSGAKNDRVDVTKMLSLNGHLMLNALSEDVYDFEKSKEYIIANYFGGVVGNYSDVEGLIGSYYGEVTTGNNVVSLKVEIHDYITQLGAYAQTGNAKNSIIELAESLTSLQSVYINGGQSQSPFNASDEALIKALNRLSPS